MGFKPILNAFLFVLYSITGSAKVNQYQVGTATVSIDPLPYPFSLALAGYGAPREGRFSLEWMKESAAPEISVFAGSGNTLYAVSGDNLVSRKVENEQTVWSSAGKAAGLRLLAGNGNKLYGINDKDELLVTSSTGKKKWKKIGIVPESVTAAAVPKAIALTVANNKLYMTDSEGWLWSSGSLSSSNIQWSKTGLRKVMICLAGIRNRLYAISDDNSLWELDINNKRAAWLKVACNNGTTFDLPVKFLAIAGDRLYAIGSEGLYKAEHSSDHSLSAGAIAVKGANQTIVIARVDLLGFNESFTSSIKEAIFQKYNIPPAAVLLNASHTHFAPVSQYWPTWGKHNQDPDSSYYYGVVKAGIIQAIENALNNMSRADLYFGRGTTAIGGNRSLSEPPIPYDNAVDVLKVIPAGKENKSLLFLMGCHPVFKNEGKEGVTISANYPGVTGEVLKNAGISNALFIQGCGGDINPISDNHQETGTMMANDIENVLSGTMEKLTGTISYSLDTINIPVNPWSVEAIKKFKAENSGHEGDVYAEKNVRWADMMLSGSAGNFPDVLPVYLQTINIGNWKLVGLSREAVTDYSIGIKKLWPGKFVSVAGYCNDVPSYLPASRHIEAGTYEGYDSFFWYGEKALLPANVYEIILNRIKTINR